MDKNTIIYALLTDIEEYFKFNIISIEGCFKKLQKKSCRITNPQLYKQLSQIRSNSPLIISSQLFDGNIPLCNPIQTLSMDMENTADYQRKDFSSNSKQAENGNDVLDGILSNTLSVENANNGTGTIVLIKGKSSPFRRVYNQWIVLPIKYSQLPLNSVLRFKIYEYVDNIQCLFGECEVQVFNTTELVLKKGYENVMVELNKERFPLDFDPKKYNHELNKVNELLKKYENMMTVNNEEKIPGSGNDEWIKNLILDKIEIMNHQLNVTNWNHFNLSLEFVNYDVVVIFNEYDYNNVENLEVHPASSNILNNGAANKNNNNNQVIVENLIDIDSQNNNFKFDTRKVFDLEQNQKIQPIEIKYHQLERASLNNWKFKDLTDKNLKPNLETKRKLIKILGYSSIKQLDNYEKNLIYKFRYYLINDFKLNSFSLNHSNFINLLLKSINWENENEVMEIKDILNWLITSNLNISLTNTLELLGPLFKQNTLVRNFAVNILKYFDDDDLVLYLLQLVQALKFDTYESADIPLSNMNNPNNNRNSTNYNNPTNTGNTREDILDYINSLKYNKNSGPGSSLSMETSISNNNYNNTEDQNTVDDVADGNKDDLAVGFQDEFFEPSLSPLANFLIYKATSNGKLGNFFYWFISMESSDTENEFKTHLIFKKILKVFLKKLKEEESNKNNKNNNGSSFGEANDTGANSWYRLSYSELMEQIQFVKNISKLTLLVSSGKKTTPEKAKFLKQFLLKNESGYYLFDPKNNSKLLRIPLNPNIEIFYVVAEECSVFKSSLSPLKLTFKTKPFKDSDGDLRDTYSFMYKIGDDLRQDQLIIQIIKLIEKLLKDENMNLKLNPYEILATRLNEGMIEFVPNYTLDKILSKYSNILNFFNVENPYGEFANARKHMVDDIQNSIADAMKNTNINGESGDVHGNGSGNYITSNDQIISNNNPTVVTADSIHPKIMDNFVKSCAGYCVITYLLGIGDRHLDNLLIRKNGQFFHVDFGYILGKDPKPFPPLMKLPIEIVDGFGGLGSEQFEKFKNYCFVCFLTLRKNSNLILNLLELMKSANIPDLKNDSLNAILKVQEKFALDLNDEEAIVYFQGLITNSVNAFFPVVIDRLHTLAQYWRA